MKVLVFCLVNLMINQSVKGSQLTLYCYALGSNQYSLSNQMLVIVMILTERNIDCFI